MRVFEWQTWMRKETERLVRAWERPAAAGACTMGRSGPCGRIALEHTCWDPKDGELCLNRAKPEETLVEARRDSDVQIDLRIWV
jgi:hypothetical protein